MANGLPRPRTVSRRRWFSVLATGVTAFAITLTIAFIEKARLSTISLLPPWLLTLPVAAGVALLFHIGPRKLAGALGLRHTLAYPPHWLGAVLGAGAALVALTNVEVVNASFGLSGATEDTLQTWSLVALAIALAPLAGHLVFALFRVRRKGTQWTDSNASLPSRRLQDLRAWYLDDVPVVSAAGDLFDHEPIAKRIAQRLVTEQAQAQALLGRLGSGKTTVRNLVEEYLRLRYPHAPIAIVTVELWPYETPTAAVEGVLRAVVGALAAHVHTSQLTGVPAAYAETIAHATGMAKWIPRVREERSTPSELLKKLDDVAKAVDRRLVLWVDDLERFAFGDPKPKKTTPAELERLAPIRALLYGLDRLDSITVVTATTDLFRRFDLEKVARYVERLPDLTYREVRKIIAAARAEWMGGAPYVDPVESREKLGWQLRDEQLGFDFLGHSVHDLAAAVSSLATTPRILKQGLRRCDEVWTRLRGEIDLDDLLAISMVREAAPDAFAVIEKNVQRLRGLVFDPRGQDRNPLAEVGKEIEALKLDERTTKAIAFVLKSLFSKNEARPQGFYPSKPVDYWQRFMSAAASGAENDQRVLSVLARGSDADIAVQLSKHPGAVENFARMLSAERLQSLLVPLVRIHLDELQTAWREQKDPPGLIPLWRMLLDRQGALDLAQLTNDTLEALAISAPKNVALMERVANWMTAIGREVEELLSEEQRTTVLQRARELLRDTYTGKPRELVLGLNGALPYTLLWLCWTKPELRARTLSAPFEGWAGFAATLREAVLLEPVEMAPHLACLVVHQIGTPDQLIFLRDFCEALFGNADDLIADIKTALANRDAGVAVATMLEQRTSRYYGDDPDERE